MGGVMDSGVSWRRYMDDGNLSLVLMGLVMFVWVYG